MTSSSMLLGLGLDLKMTATKKYLLDSASRKDTVREFDAHISCSGFHLVD